MRNEIFARHGYIFKDQQLNNYFSSQSWYRGERNDVSMQLTTLEKMNIEFIKSFVLKVDETPVPVATRAIPTDDIIGSWKGSFGNSDITLVIQSVGNNYTATGYNTLNGNTRPLSGRMEINNDDRIHITLSEPGDRHSDGTFNMIFDEANTVLSGSWKENNSALKRDFSLTKN